MKPENKNAMKSEIVDLWEEFTFYESIGKAAQTECQKIDTKIKSLKILAFKDIKDSAKVKFNSLREV